MALINCPECGKEISDMAKNCPNCGRPIINKDTYKYFNNANKQQKITTEKVRSILGIASILCMFITHSRFIFFIISGIILLILRKKRIGSIIASILSFMGTAIYMNGNYVTNTFGVLFCWVLTISTIITCLKNK